MGALEACTRPASFISFLVLDTPPLVCQFFSFLLLTFPSIVLALPISEALSFLHAFRNLTDCLLLTPSRV